MKLSDELVKIGLDELDRFTRRAAEWGSRGARRSVVQRLVTGSSSAKGMEALFGSFQDVVEAGRHLKLDVERLLDGRSISTLTDEELRVLNVNFTNIRQFLNAVEAAVLLAGEKSNSR